MAARRTVATFLISSVLVGACGWAASPLRAQTSPPSAVGADKAWPVTLADARRAADVDPMAWTGQEVDEALARCKVLLKGLDVDAIEDSPLKEGESCGSAAPLRLIAVGKGRDKVTFMPQPTVSCELAAALARWVKHDLQGLARKHLGARLQQVETMSSYSCRNAYGRKTGRLSEHARANAIDISGFTTERKRVVSVEGNWGLTRREIIAKAHEHQAAQAAAQIRPVTSQPKLQSNAVPRPAQPIAEPEPTLADQGRGLFAGRSSTQESAFPTALGFDAPSRLGGPRPERSAPGARHEAGTLEFMRAAHKSACAIFATTLGPEANRTHSNHFHVDMAARGQTLKICD